MYKTLEECEQELAEWESKYPIQAYLKYKLYYPFCNLRDKLLNIPNEIKYFIQRGRRGWATCDTWSYYSYNARINKEAIQKIRNSEYIGIPSVMFDINEARDPTGEEEKEALKKWYEILDDMIFAFDQVVQCDNNLIRWEGINIDWSDFIKRYPETKLQTEEEYNRMKRGMQYFVDYYFSLWT